MVCICYSDQIQHTQRWKLSRLLQADSTQISTFRMFRRIFQRCFQIWGNCHIYTQNLTNKWHTANIFDFTYMLFSTNAWFYSVSPVYCSFFLNFGYSFLLGFHYVLCINYMQLKYMHISKRVASIKANKVEGENHEINAERVRFGILKENQS